MTVLPATRPRSLARTVTRLPPLPVDLLILAIAETSLMWGVVQSQNADVASGGVPWPGWIWPAVALLPVPLLWRRRAPFAVLMLSGHTVKTHVGNVLAKLHLRDRIHAVVYAYESGLIQPGR